jgi:cytochrome c5
MASGRGVPRTVIARAVAAVVGAAGAWTVLPALVDGATATLLIRYRPRLRATDYDALRDHLFAAMVPATLALGVAVYLAASLVLRRALRDPTAPRPERIRRIAAAVPATAFLAFFAAVLSLALVDIARRTAAPGRAEFEATCGRCHGVARPLDFIQPVLGWRRTTERMAARSGSGIREEQRRAAEAYLTRVRSIAVPALVKGRCGACHEAPRAASVPRPAGEIVRMIERLRALDARFCEPDEAERIAAYLTDGRAAAPEAGPALLERACETCHFLDAIQRPAAGEDVTAMLARMQEKAPAILGEGEALGLVSVIERERADPAGFRRRYPHSGLTSPWGAR